MRGTWSGGGRWQRYDRMRGDGPTMAHFEGTNARGYFIGAVCGYDPHRGLKSPSAVRIVDPEPGDPRCSRCEKRVAERVA
jgi:hypothetical protein